MLIQPAGPDIRPGLFAGVAAISDRGLPRSENTQGKPMRLPISGRCKRNLVFLLLLIVLRSLGGLLFGYRFFGYSFFGYSGLGCIL